jgi:hypothetical protein
MNGKQIGADTSNALDALDKTQIASLTILKNQERVP